MIASLHYTNLSARRLIALLISVMTLIATLPMTAQNIVEGDPLDLANLNEQTIGRGVDLRPSGTNEWQVQQNILPTPKTLFRNGVLTGVAPQEIKHKFMVSLIPGSKYENPTLTLENATITSNIDKLFYIDPVMDMTFRIVGKNHVNIQNDFILNKGTLNLVVVDTFKINFGILNESSNNVPSKLTIDARKPLILNHIINSTKSTMHLGGEIHFIGTGEDLPIQNHNTSPDAITFEPDARIFLQSKSTTALTLSDHPFIEMSFATAPAAGQTLSFTPAGTTAPAATFTTDGTCTKYAFLATPGTRYTATLGATRLFATSANENYALFRTDSTFKQYTDATFTRPEPQPLSLITESKQDPTRTGFDFHYDPVSGWTLDNGKIFNGTVTTDGKTMIIPTTIHAEGEATLTLYDANIRLQTGTALTIASGTVKLQSINTELIGTYALRVETGATCLILPPAADTPDNVISLMATENAIHPDGGGTVKGLVQLTWKDTPLSNISFIPEESSEGLIGDKFNFANQKSIATNYPRPFQLWNTNYNLRQEGYLSDDPQGIYLSTFPGAMANALINYTGLRNGSPDWIVIDKPTDFDASNMERQWLRVTEKGILTVKESNSGSQIVKGIELREGGQIRLSENATIAVDSFIRVFSNDNQWKATTVPSYNCLKLSTDKGSPTYVRTGYTDVTSQAWQPAEPDKLSTLSGGTPILIAGDGPATDTMRLECGSFDMTPSTPATSPAEPLNTGVFLFKGNLTPYNVEMRNIYVLSDDGSRFDLREAVTLLPYQSYVVANAATQAMMKSLRMDGIVTGTEIAPVDNSLRAWAAHGRLHLRAERAEKVAIYHISGALKCYLPLLRDETTIALPAGIYLVHQGGTTIKIVL